MRKDEAEQTIRKAIPWAKRVSISGFAGGTWIVISDTEELAAAHLVLYANGKTMTAAVNDAIITWAGVR